MRLPVIIWKLAEPKTCWWSNTKARRRMDTLVGVHRTYSRIHRNYIYSMTVGRFRIGVMF